MGCRQSKYSEGVAAGQTTLLWLTNLGLQEYYPAFAKAGYSSVSSLAALEEKNLRVVAQFCPNGIPAEHRQRLLSAAKQVAEQQSSSLASTVGKLSTAGGIASPHRRQPSPTADQQQPSHQQVDNPRLQAHAASMASHRGLDDSLTTYSSYTSCSSAASGFNSTEYNSKASTQQSAATIASKQPSPAVQAKRVAAVDSRPAPTLDQLQQLHSQVEADYARVQRRPAHARAFAKAAPAVVAPTASGVGSATSPHSGAKTQQAVLSAGMADSHAQEVQPAQTMPFTPRKQQLSIAANSVSSAKSSAQSSRLAAAKQARADAFVALKQLKKAKKSWPDEPFVQVFTNFDRLSQDVSSATSPLQQDPVPADPPNDDDCQQSPFQLIAAQHAAVASQNHKAVASQDYQNAASQDHAQHQGMPFAAPAHDHLHWQSHTPLQLIAAQHVSNANASFSYPQHPLPSVSSHGPLDSKAQLQLPPQAARSWAEEQFAQHQQAAASDVTHSTLAHPRSQPNAAISQAQPFWSAVKHPQIPCADPQRQPDAAVHGQSVPTSQNQFVCHPQMHHMQGSHALLIAPQVPLDDGHWSVKGCVPQAPVHQQRSHLEVTFQPPPHSVQAVAYQAAFSASSVSVQTPQLRQVSQSASQYGAQHIQHSSGHVTSNQFNQYRTRSSIDPVDMASTQQQHQQQQQQHHHPHHEYEHQQQQQQQQSLWTGSSEGYAAGQEQSYWAGQNQHPEDVQHQGPGNNTQPDQAGQGQGCITQQEQGWGAGQNQNPWARQQQGQRGNSQSDQAEPGQGYWAGQYQNYGAGQQSGYGAGQDQPFVIHAVHQAHTAEHSVSRTGVTTSSSSHRSEFSFRSSGHSSHERNSGAAVVQSAQSYQDHGASAAAEALRVIRAAKQHRSGNAPQQAAPLVPPQPWAYRQEQGHAMRQQMQQMDAQIRQRVQQLQQCL